MKRWIGAPLSVLLLSSFVWATPGDLVSFTEKNAIGSVELARKIGEACPQTRSKIANSRIRFFVVSYETTDTKGIPTHASAALFIPENGARRYDLVSYQHGTTIERRMAPSLGDGWSEGRDMGACYGSQGYAVIEADYLGYGASNGFHPYLHARSEATATADAIRAGKAAARRLGLALNGKLFLSGYSQGGHATMALHRYLQTSLRREFIVSASAPMAGPYEPAETVRVALRTPDWATTAEAVFLVKAYHELYGLFRSLDEALLPEYVSLAENDFPGHKSFDDVVKALPRNPADLLALAEETMRKHGAKTQLIWIQGADHASAAPEAISKSIDWFNSLRCYIPRNGLKASPGPLGT